MKRNQINNSNSNALSAGTNKLTYLNNRSGGAGIADSSFYFNDEEILRLFEALE